MKVKLVTWIILNKLLSVENGGYKNVILFKSLATYLIEAKTMLLTLNVTAVLEICKVKKYGYPIEQPLLIIK